MTYDPIISSNIQPTDVKIYVENGVPYLDYIGTFYTIDGTRCKVHFPKIGLTFSRIIQEKDEHYDYLGYRRSIMPTFNVYAANDNVSFEIIERDVSKEQLEKELGYKINIKEET